MMMVMTRKILRHGIFPLILVTSMVVTRAEQKIDESSGTTRGSAETEMTSDKVVHVHAQRVFRYAFNPNMFKWKQGDYGGINRFSYSYLPALRGLPDMPTWLKYKYSQRHSSGFIYGVPPRANEIYQLSVVATNRETFETGLLNLTINVTATTQSTAKYNIKLKIDNLNIEDVFDAHRLKNLKNLFKDQFWPQASSDLHMTDIASSLEVGYRRPLMPTERDGVVLQLGSHANFSKDLLLLDRETSPLRVRPSCPRNFKRTSVERYFRDKGFAIDWCAFRLLVLDQKSSSEDTTAIYKELGHFFTTEDPTGTSSEAPASLAPSSGDSLTQHYRQHLKSLLSNDNNQLPLRTSVPYRDITSEFLYTAIPAGLVFVLTALVLLGLLCIKKKDEPEEEWQAFTESLFLVVKDCFTCCHAAETKEMAMQTKLLDSNSTLAIMDPARSHRASSVARQTDSLRRLAQSRDVTPMLVQTTPHVPGQPPPPSWPPRGSSYTPVPLSPSNSLAQFGTIDSGRAALNRPEYESFLQRPAPPPYSSCTRLPQELDDQGTYLV